MRCDYVIKPHTREDTDGGDNDMAVPWCECLQRDLQLREGVGRQEEGGGSHHLHGERRSLELQQDVYDARWTQGKQEDD